jgi:hypothetical protein
VSETVREGGRERVRERERDEEREGESEREKIGKSTNYTSVNINHGTIPHISNC